MAEDLNPIDERMLQGIQYFFSKIPFNNLLGIEIETVTAKRVALKMPMRDDLIGNFSQGILHGGVLSSLLDVAGGAVALIGAYQRMADLDDAEKIKVLSKVGTIDMRVDFVRPGKGEWFLAEARVLRTGNKVSVTRMEVHNDRDELIALGTGTYLCG